MGHSTISELQLLGIKVVGVPTGGLDFAEKVWLCEGNDGSLRNDAH